MTKEELVQGLHDSKTLCQITQDGGHIKTDMAEFFYRIKVRTEFDIIYISDYAFNSIPLDECIADDADLSQLLGGCYTARDIRALAQNDNRLTSILLSSLKTLNGEDPTTILEEAKDELREERGREAYQTLLAALPKSEEDAGDQQIWTTPDPEGSVIKCEGIHTAIAIKRLLVAAGCKKAQSEFVNGRDCNTFAVSVPKKEEPDHA